MAPAKKTGVLIVDDSAFSRQTIKKMLETDSNIETLAVAIDGYDAIAKTIRFKPDIITLDFEMPEMDGFAFLRWLMKEQPTPVIMVSSYSDSKTVFKALELGAVDFIAKPTRRASEELRSIQSDLLEKVLNIKKMSLNKLRGNLERISEMDEVEAEPKARKEDLPETPAGKRLTDVIAIGSSTGGPAALQLVLTSLPAKFKPAILISQHMPKGFTKSLAERLNRLSAITIKEAKDGDLISPSTAYICPGGLHMGVKKKKGYYYTVLQGQRSTDKYVPSIDHMMRSVAGSFGKNAVGVILTGMGDDGRKGMLEIKKKGGYTIAESEETAVIYGMPREAINSGAADLVRPLHSIPDEFVSLFKGK
ncbi:MAG: chemotaxis response regulator protein-glutamate methylesterase [Nitrospirota bacterium]|nr:MAG: chemotaxis response regulator protein-glutamate methylesterase [Nitrospirota bacterium]